MYLQIIAARFLFVMCSVARASEVAIGPSTFTKVPTMHLANTSQIIPPGYDKSAYPDPEGTGPLRCFLTFSVENILVIDEARGYLKYQIYLAVYWPDRRLVIPEDARNYSSVTLDPSLARQFWMPDLMIYNLEDMQPVKLLRHIGSLTLIKSGYVQYGLYLRTSVTCNMEFSSYPFDSQECYVEFGSYSYNGSQMLWSWLPQPGHIYSTDTMTRRNFIVNIERNGPLNHCYGTGEDEDCYATVLVTVRLRRRTVFFLWHTFLPCVLLVTTSWLSMLLPPEVIPGRMVLCITSLLALLTMFTSSLTGLEVSYIRASDVWYVGCLIFDFFIILEYVVILFVQRLKTEATETWAHPRQVHPTERAQKMVKAAPGKAMSGIWRLLENPAQADCVSRWVLAVLFIGFNIGYWAYYTI